MKASALHKTTVKVFLPVICVLLLFSACKPGGEEETTAAFYEPTSAVMPEGVITVPFTSLDTVNPYFCGSLLNSSLTSLVFRSLYRLDGGFSPVKDMAVSETVTGNTVKVEIDGNLVFSDARPVTSEDIIYSFELAKKSPLWSQTLASVKSCSAEGTYAVIFTLDEPDINALSLLAFPIAEAGSADSEEQYPVGAGFYKYERKDMRTVLTCNLRYAGELPDIGTVRLYDVTDSSSLMHLLDTGVIDCFFSDLAEGTAKRTYSSVNEVYLNNLVYLGLNYDSYRLSMTDIRRAVSMAVDRRALAENAFLNHARAAWLPFNMSWTAITDSAFTSAYSADSDIRAADALLDEAGCGVSGDRIYFTLICRDENSFIKNTAALIAEQLALVNIEVDVRLLSSGAFAAALRDGEYDMYLSEIKLTKNMDLSPFFTSDGAASAGINLRGLNIDDEYFRYRGGEIDIAEFLAAFDECVPFVPLLYRNGQFCYSRGIAGVAETAEGALFSSIAAWTLR